MGCTAIKHPLLFLPQTSAFLKVKTLRFPVILNGLKLSIFNSKESVIVQVETIIEQGKARGEQVGVPYAGIFTPQEANTVLEQTPNAILVDVRTRAELELVGYIPFATHIEWAFYPGMTPNNAFPAELETNVAKDALVIFICRTGGRSHNAALLAQQLGYTNAYNMMEGFEGEPNQNRQRTLINGWRHAGLPWSN